MRQLTHNLPLNKPSLVGNELKYLSETAEAGFFSGPGHYTQKCEQFIETLLGGSRVLLTPSCNSALELAALACNISEGDEVILPAFTHPATANAFLMRGARPVFVDIRPDTCNIDDGLIEAAITERTRAIVPVHYAGVACAMNEITDVASRKSIQVVEDAAHAIGARYQERHLGTIGQFGAFSFHGTKNLSCGEGGALIVKNPAQIQQVEMMRENGTDRQRYMRGETHAYGWMTIGGSFLMPELSAAFLFGQLEQVECITNWRVKAFNKYFSALQPLVALGAIQSPTVPGGCTPNGHIFYGICRESGIRDKLINYLQSRGIGATFHYLPLHLSPQGRTYGYRQGQLPVTEMVSANLFRLPLYFGITDEQIAAVVAEVFAFFGEKHNM
jgi:dTDP-4-amino-4,6-dideoxygalactose transaminase